MQIITLILTLSLLLPSALSADWRQELETLQNEVVELTANADKLADEERLARFYRISFDLSMLDNPSFATYLGDPRGQDRLTDLSPEAIERRRQSERQALAFVESIDRSGLPENEQVNYDLLLDRLRNDVREQQFPNHYLPMNQMSGPQQNIASLLAMMPNGKPGELENQIARMQALLADTDTERLLRAGGEQGLAPEGEGLGRATLERWLRAEKGDAESAAARLKAHAVWRADYVSAMRGGGGCVAQGNGALPRIVGVSVGFRKRKKHNRAPSSHLPPPSSVSPGPQRRHRRGTRSNGERGSASSAFPALFESGAPETKE